MQPKFLQEGESVAEAVERVGETAVIIDCDHPGCTEESIALIKKSGGEPVLFSPYRMEREVTQLAARYRTKSFILPTDPDTFGRLLKS